MVDIYEVAQKIYLIDNQLHSMPKWGSVYLLDEEEKALIDPGPTASVGPVLDGIKKVGVRPQDIAYIIVTHIHLDHAGGVGVLLKNMPQAQVVVHYRGAKHLINPERLVNSAIETQGKETIANLGEVLPIEEHRVQSVHGGETIRLGEKQVLKFIDAPGHAPHELCIYETRNGGLFVGDAVGIYVGENEILLPVHPPPQFDLELCLDTLEKLARLAPTRLYYTHFGVSNKAQDNLQLARETLQIWNDIIAKATKENALDDAGRRLVAQICAELEPIKEVESLRSVYEHLTREHLPLCAAGHIKHYQETNEA